MSRGADDEALRIRLEGDAPLLEQAHAHARTLVRALEKFWWKGQVRRCSEVLRAAAAAQPEVERALKTARHLLERTPADGPLAREVRELVDLEAKLLALVTRRLGEAPVDLSTGLAELEARVLNAPHLVLPTRRWVTACEVLSNSVLELSLLRAFSVAAEAAVGPPGQVRATHWRALEDAWEPSGKALEQAWRRVDGIDLSGGIGRSLRRRARRAPRFSPSEEGTGPAVLARAEYWRHHAQDRAQHALAQAIAPVRATPTEVWPTFCWLMAHRERPRLEHPTLPAARAALLQLAAHLGGTLTAAPHEHLVALAERADGEFYSDDWIRLRDGLALAVRASNPGRWLPPVLRSASGPGGADSDPKPAAQTLAALISQLQARLTQNKH